MNAYNSSGSGNNKLTKSMSIDDYLFGPITSINYCYLFYVMSVIGFTYLILVIISGIILLIKKKGDSRVVFSLFQAVGASFFLYIQNRLLYTMCFQSI